MKQEVVRLVSLSRHLFELGQESLRSKNDLFLFSAANLLQDAVEAFVIAVADELSIAVLPNTPFDKYFVAVNDRISPRELPFKAALIQLNKIRVNSKHYGIQPARSECDRLALVIDEFFDEVSRSILNAEYSSIGAVTLLEDGEVRSHVFDAITARKQGMLADCSIACRKALYVLVEWCYDVSRYRDGRPVVGLLGAWCRAPYYAQTKTYIEEHVCDPTEFIVLDHSRIDQELLTNGVDPVTFWNVRRLTPAVFKQEGGVWIVKHEFSKLDEAVLQEHIDYILSATTDIALAFQTSRSGVKSFTHGKFQVALARDGVPIYKRADRTSEIVATTPPGMQEVDTSHRISGLSDDGEYWFVDHFPNGGPIFHGYIHSDDTQ